MDENKLHLNNFFKIVVQEQFLQKESRSRKGKTLSWSLGEGA
jgi:hypothetical protein